MLPFIPLRFQSYIFDRYHNVSYVLSVYVWTVGTAEVKALCFDVIVCFTSQFINWKLEHVGMNPTAESYLLLHRFGSVSA